MHRATTHSAALRRLTLAFIIAAMASGCQGSSDSPVAPNITSTTFAAALGVDLNASTKTATGLYYRDLIAGTGTAVSSGNVLTVRYTGWFTNGTQFDTNQSATGFGFTIGAGQVISGWDQGLIGMKVGGRRQLIIPPALGYGTAGSGSIPGNSILVFTVDVLTAR